MHENRKIRTRFYFSVLTDRTPRQRGIAALAASVFFFRIPFAISALFAVTPFFSDLLRSRSSVAVVKSMLLTSMNKQAGK